MKLVSWIVLSIFILSSSCTQNRQNKKVPQRRDERKKILAPFEGIFLQINAIIVQEERKYSNNLNDSIESARKFNEKLSRLSSPKAEEFRHQYYDMVHDFGIEMPIGYLEISLYKFKKFGGRNARDIIQRNITELKRSVEDSLKWYSFLEKLRDTYNVPNKIIFSTDFKEKDENDNIQEPFSSTALAKSITQLDPKLYKDLQDANKDVQHLMLNTNKLNLLHAVVKELKQPNTEHCKGDTLHVRGFNVLLSNVVNIHCFKAAKHVQIFAWNKVFIDTSIVKPSLDTIIISPVWEIVRKYEFNFHGKDHLINYIQSLIPDAAAPSSNSNTNGTDGKTGKSGGWGGRFVGFGREIYGNLVVNLNGGVGGRGENGGKGFHGIPGKDVPKGKELDYLNTHFNRNRTDGRSEEEKRRDDSSTGRIGDFLHDVGNTILAKGPTYKFHGTPATPPTRGGDGGCGGPGGHGGTFLSLGFENSKAFTVKNENGQKGNFGAGGKGGDPARNGNDLIRESSGDEETITMGYSSSAGNGKSGQYLGKCRKLRSTEPQPKLIDPVKIFNEYKYYTREIFANETFDVSELKYFLKYMDNYEDLNDRYDIYNLIDDFNSTESQYFELHSNISFNSYYKSLISRSEMYSRKLKGKDRKDRTDEKRALNYLYTAVKSRLFVMETNVNNVAVVDLLDYMRGIKNRMHEAADKRSIDGYSDAFKNEMDKKIGDANNMISKYVLPSIGDAVKRTNEGINKLLGEVHEAADDNEKNMIKARSNAIVMNEKLLAHELLSAVKLIGSVVLVLGPEGAVAGAALLGISSVAEVIIDKAYQEKTVKFQSQFTDTVLEISKQSRSYIENAERQLQQLQNILNASDTTTSKRFDINLKEYNKTIADAKKASEESMFVSSDVMSAVQSQQESFSNKIDETINDMKETGKGSRKYKTLKGMKYTLAVSQPLTATKTKVDAIYKQLDDNDDTIEKLNREAQLIRRHELNIYNVMLPVFKSMEQSLKGVTEQSKDKSHVELDITKWSIQNKLKKVKDIFNKMSTGFKVNTDLMSCIAEVTDSILTVMDVYDRIDSYKEQTRMATLISKVASKQDSFAEIGNAVLREAFQYLDQRIKENLAMEQFEMAMSALKLHTFPYAGNYLQNYTLPSDVSLTKGEVIRKMNNNIDEVVHKLELYNNHIVISDEFLIPNISFTKKKAFYTWDDSHKDSFNRLLSGEKLILFDANIKNEKRIHHDVSELTAIKFSNIWIEFVLKNEAEQIEFYKAMAEDYIVRMEMAGNNYYRCNDRIYYNSINVPVAYRFKLDQNGYPHEQNTVAEKLEHNKKFLSPYITWKISLLKKPKRSFESFSKRFSNQVDKILLVGHAESIEDYDKDYVPTICNKNLDQFYRFDSTIDKPGS